MLPKKAKRRKEGTPKNYRRPEPRGGFGIDGLTQFREGQWTREKAHGSHQVRGTTWT